MKRLILISIFIFGPLAQAAGGYISNVALKTESGAIDARVQCFVDEALKQVHTEFHFPKIAYAQIDKAGLPEDEGLYASIVFLAKNKTDSSTKQFAVTIASDIETSRWEYIQGANSIYPFSAKVSDFATTNMKGSAPSYLLLSSCQ